MLSKKRIDKKLRKYVSEHLSKGYSKHAVKKVLVEHGYDENYVEWLLKKHSELQLVKKYAIIVSLLFIASFFSFNLINFKFIRDGSQQITGYAIIDKSEGCCLSICQQTAKQDCYGKFVDKKRCNELDECIVGCCIDKEGYCLTNYLLGNCIGDYGKFIKNDCNNLLFCRNLTDKSYSARLYNVKNKKGSGFSTIKTFTNSYKSSFTINYFLYDKANVVGLVAEISDNNKIVDTINLYDDGSHNDGLRDDNLYGNNWQSSNVKDFSGIKKLDVYINIKYRDGSEQKTNKIQTIILTKGKCFPIYNEWSEIKNLSIIFAANNYGDISNGYEKFTNDVQNFLDLFFSVEKLSSYADTFNIYRLEQSLSYFNTPTLLTVIANSCPLYDKKNYILVVLDANEEYCSHENANVIRLSPQVMFYTNITNQSINETFRNLCDYVLTPKRLADQILNFAAPPQINLITQQDVIYNTINTTLSFEIAATNYPVNYSVFDKNGTFYRNVTHDKVITEVQLSLTNGTNDFMVTAIDKNRNRAVAYISLNTVIE